jgi:hypothetical protein
VQRSQLANIRVAHRVAVAVVVDSKDMHIHLREHQLYRMRCKQLIAAKQMEARLDKDH